MYLCLFLDNVFYSISLSDHYILLHSHKNVNSMTVILVPPVASWNGAYQKVITQEIHIE